MSFGGRWEGTGPPSCMKCSMLGVGVDKAEHKMSASPHGLHGVAWRGMAMQNVIHQFTSLAKDSRVGFVGNVCVGQDVSLRELRERYNAVVLAYGAESDRALGVPGEVGCLREAAAGGLALPCMDCGNSAWAARCVPRLQMHARQGQLHVRAGMSGTTRTPICLGA